MDAVEVPHPGLQQARFGIHDIDIAPEEAFRFRVGRDGVAGVGLPVAGGLPRCVFADGDHAPLEGRDLRLGQEWPL